MHIRSVILACAATLVIAVPPSQAASIVSDGGFESGFSAWDTTGNASVVGASFGTGPFQGSSQALLNTDSSTEVSSLESFLGLTANSLRGISTGPVIQGSGLRQVVSLNAGDVVSFSWNFLTNELTPPTNNDFAFYTLTDLTLLASTTAGFAPSSSLLFDSETGFRTVQLAVNRTGSYLLGFGVVDVTDNSVSSGLLVDNVRVNGILTNQPIPEPTPLPGLLAFSALGSLWLWLRQGLCRKN